MLVKCKGCAGTGRRLRRVGERVGWVTCSECEGVGRV